jgi:seryl-tRNA(Sec) selenium transferase
MLLDDAAGIPPIENRSLYARMGLDFYTFSGGKGLAGPQCSGLLLGRKNLIEAALANCCPWKRAVCRAMKFEKEDIMGCLAAVEARKKKDLNALDKEWAAHVNRIVRLIQTVDGVRTDVRIPEGGNRYPTLAVEWDPAAFAFTVPDCVRELSEGEPRIEVLSASNPSMVPAVHEDSENEPVKRKGEPSPDRLRIVPSTLQPGEDLIVDKRLRAIVAGCREPSAEAWVIVEH